MWECHIYPVSLEVLSLGQGLSAEAAATDVMQTGLWTLAAEYKQLLTHGLLADFKLSTPTNPLSAAGNSLYFPPESKSRT